MGEALQPQAIAAAAAEPADAEAARDSLAFETSPLPEALPLLPTARPETSLASADTALPPIAPAGFAGPTPTQPAAARLLPAPTAAPTAAATPVAAPVAAPLAMAAAGIIHAPAGRLGPSSVSARSPELDLLIAKYARHYDVPVELVRRVVKRESTFNPKARNGPYWGLMQILPATARGMGHKGPASDLLDAETNLKYAVRYLRGAYITAGGNHDLAVRYYARGYYYDAKRKGLLDETGLGNDRRRRAR